MTHLQKNTELKGDQADPDSDIDSSIENLDILDDGDNVFAQNFETEDNDNGAENQTQFSNNQSFGFFETPKVTNKVTAGAARKDSKKKGSGLFGLLGKVKDNLFSMPGNTNQLTELNSNDISLLQKEIELMTKEYPKHPDFVKRLVSLIQDNLRLRLLLENQLVLDEEKKSSVILMQFMLFYDEIQTMRKQLYTQKMGLNQVIQEKDNIIKNLKDQINNAQDAMLNRDQEQNEFMSRQMKNMEAMKKQNQSGGPWEQKYKQQVEHTAKLLQLCSSGIDNGKTRYLEGFRPF